MKTEKNLDLWILKFKIEKQIPLKKILPRMGIKSMFAPLAANFKLLTEQSIYVSEMQQKARIDRIRKWDLQTCPKCGGKMSPTGEHEFWT